jgi:hypothetical protein
MALFYPNPGLPLRKIRFSSEKAKSSSQEERLKKPCGVSKG